MKRKNVTMKKLLAVVMAFAMMLGCVVVAPTNVQAGYTTGSSVA